jgi:pimeloyl-ACP methyl ester carboxylesterase
MRVLKWLGYFVAVLIFFVIAAIAFLNWFAGHRETEDRVAAAPASGRFVRAGDVDMYIQERGPKDGPAIVLMHAAGGWSGVWEQTMDELAKNGFHAIAIDAPPLGYSEKPDTPRYSREDQARRIVGVLDALDIKWATLVGHSFGGRAVAETVISYPERVSRVVLVDASIPFGVPEPSLQGSVVNYLFSIEPLRRAATAATFTNPMFTRKLLESFVYKPESATDYWVGVYQAFMRVKGTNSAVADWLQVLLAERDTSKSSDEKSYAAIRAETLVVWGDKDSTTPLSEGEHLHELIPGSELVVMSDIGHLPPIEDTKAFNKILLDFLMN